MRFASRSIRLASSRSTRMVLCALSLGTVLASAAHAQVTFSLTPPDKQYVPSSSSQTVIFTGMITNLGSSTVFLNDISITLDAYSSQFATPNTYLFFDSVPLSLAAAGDANGGDRYSGTIFGVDLGPTDTNPYSFNGTATLRGGAMETSLDTLGTLQQFLGTPATVVTPEPNAFALTSCGLLGIAGTALVRRRRATKASPA